MLLKRTLLIYSLASTRPYVTSNPFLSIFTITGTVHKKGGGKMDDIEYDDGFTLDEAMRVVKSY